jgi:phenylacetyl-CoA:acceptor oxidoreductase subunit 2
LRRLAWKIYLDTLIGTGAPRKALDILQAFGVRFEKFGQLLPEMMILATLLFGDGTGGLLAVAGLVASGTGWWLKFTIVARAAFNQGFALPVLPIRGQGKEMPGVKPGWSK